MKLPPSKTPPSEKPPTYDKDKTFTKRTVKGAAGGMLGADYEDDRRATGPNTNRRGRPVADGDTASIAEEYRAALASEQHSQTNAGVQGYGADHVIVEDDDSIVSAAQAENRRKRRHVARDRLSVDKDAPETLRRPSYDRDEDTNEPEPEESSEQEIEVFSDGLLKNGAPAEPRAHLFAAHQEREPGDLSLIDPEEIQRVLSSPAGYAKHSMILAEAFRRSTGATREEAIAYLGRMFVALKDRSFGRTALKEFGPASGILDLYPLEVIEHVLEHYPSFLPKVGFGRFFRHQIEDIAVLVTDTITPLFLEYPPELKIRGFAVRGGSRPGYLFEPADDPGKYKLQINSPGRFNFLISSLSRTGYTMIERLDVLVKPARETDTPAPQAIVIPRDPEKISAWPIPAPPAVDLRDALYATDAARARRRADVFAELRINDVLSRKPEIDLEVDESDAPIAHVVDDPSSSAEQTAPQPPPARAAAATAPAHAPAPAPVKRQPPAPPPPSRPSQPPPKSPAPRAAAPSASAPIRRPTPPTDAPIKPPPDAIAKIAAKIATASPMVAPPPTPRSESVRQEVDEPTESIPVVLISESQHDTASTSAADPEPVDRTQPIRVTYRVEEEEDAEQPDDPDPTEALDQSTHTRTPSPPSKDTRPPLSTSNPGTTSK